MANSPPRSVVALLVGVATLLPAHSGAQEPPATSPPESAIPIATPSPAPAPIAAPEPGPLSWAPPEQLSLPVFDARRARALYDENCRLCHGPAGRGDGAAARHLEPPPRDFGRGVFKFRSTASGSLPADGDLLRTLTRGLPGTTMTAWSGLSIEERGQLLQLVKSLSPRFAAEPAAPILQIGQPPALTEERLRRGRRAWERAQCAKCHGDEGRGDGPAAKEVMRDDQGRRVYPFNLSRGEAYRGGCRPEDIYRTFVTGVDGTPMPSYAEALGAEEAWDLALYTRSLIADPGSCR